MKSSQTKKLCLAAILCAVAVIGSLFSFPVLGSKCAPVQHTVNILCAVLLGPWYGVGVAFSASLIRNLFGIGSLMAFPGSMLGALLCGLIYRYTRNIPLTLLAEVFGTAVLGGLCAYPVAIFFLGKSAGEIAFYAYMFPFLVSTVGGAVLSTVFILALEKGGLLAQADCDQTIKE
ncbi:MAG: energy coupling factor transporter S component ThiW [Peptococcaceae bacterium]|jgi:energy coupling factor transporter S component ThiW|nr:energy coupling factor transporter S component ThiW [Peptococcaceae bacterium]